MTQVPLAERNVNWRAVSVSVHGWGEIVSLIEELSSDDSSSKMFGSNHFPITWANGECLLVDLAAPFPLAQGTVGFAPQPCVAEALMCGVDPSVQHANHHPLSRIRWTSQHRPGSIWQVQKVRCMCCCFLEQFVNLDRDNLRMLLEELCLQEGENPITILAGDWSRTSQGLRNKRLQLDDLDMKCSSGVQARSCPDQVLSAQF